MTIADLVSPSSLCSVRNVDFGFKTKIRNLKSEILKIPEGYYTFRETKIFWYSSVKNLFYLNDRPIPAVTTLYNALV
jgi:hypothetical protein